MARLSYATIPPYRETAKNAVTIAPRLHRGCRTGQGAPAEAAAAGEGSASVTVRAARPRMGEKSSPQVLISTGSCADEDPHRAGRPQSNPRRAPEVGPALRLEGPSAETPRTPRPGAGAGQGHLRREEGREGGRVLRHPRGPRRGPKGDQHGLPASGPATSSGNSRCSTTDRVPRRSSRRSPRPWSYSLAGSSGASPRTSPRSCVPSFRRWRVDSGKTPAPRPRSP